MAAIQSVQYVSPIYLDSLEECFCGVTSESLHYDFDNASLQSITCTACSQVFVQETLHFVPCQCGNGNRELFDYESGQCMICDGRHGEETLIDAFSQLDLSESSEDTNFGYVINLQEPIVCHCGNSNIEFFILRQTIQGRRQLQCAQCDNIIDKDIFTVAERRTLVEAAFYCETCENNNKDNFSVWQGEGCQFIKCCYCDETQCWPEIFDCEHQNFLDNKPNPGTSVDEKHSPRTRITNISEIHIGDHIMFHRFWGFWHHGIVESVDVKGNCAQVIHYSNDAKNFVHNARSSHFLKASVIREEMEMEKPIAKGEMYRVEYDEKNSPEKTVLNALSRLGEQKYNVFSMNCEHFARWCRTSIPGSKQVNDLKSTAKKWAGKLTLRTVKEVIQHIAKIGLKKAIEIGAKVIGEAVGVVIDLVQLTLNIVEAYQSYKNGKFDWHEFVNIVWKEVSHASCSSIGTIVGGIIGSIVVPIPFLGSMIGAGLGMIIGSFVGNVIGRMINSFRNLFKKN